MPLRQRIQVKESGEFHRAHAIRPVRIFPEQSASRAHELVFTFRTSMIREVEKARAPSQEWLLRFLESHAIPMVKRHSILMYQIACNRQLGSLSFEEGGKRHDLTSTIVTSTGIDPAR